MSESFGYIEQEMCGRNGCTGILYRKHRGGQCLCHLGYPPCSYCVNSIGCCPKCEWNEVESLGVRRVLFEKEEKSTWKSMLKLIWNI